MIATQLYEKQSEIWLMTDQHFSLYDICQLETWKEKKTKTRTKSKTGKKFKKSTLKTLHTTTHCKNCDCSWSYWTCQAWKWQMASLLWVYRYIDIDNVYVHSTVYLWKKNVKTLAIIKWLHHANRISFFKPLKHNMNLVERITLDLFGITKKNKQKTLSTWKSGFHPGWPLTPLLWVQKLKRVP